MTPYIRDIELPSEILQADGRMKPQLPMYRFPLDEGQIHILTASGIGDTAWVWSKLWKLAETRDVTFWFPEAGGYNRVKPYCDLVGMKYGGTLSDLDIRFLLEQPGEFTPEDYESGGVFYVHANKHIEEGNPLHWQCPKFCEKVSMAIEAKKEAPTPNYPQIPGVSRYPSVKDNTWHPWLPFKNPAPRAYETINTYSDTVCKLENSDPYVVVHMASETYCEGNWFPRVWARLIEWVEKNVAPVKLIGAKWDEGMIEKVTDIYKPALPPCIGKSFAEALTVIVNSTAMIGVDSGLSIMATYYGLPALRCYPRWLDLMRGTWEDMETLHPHNRAIFMDELIDAYKEWCEGL